MSRCQCMLHICWSCQSPPTHVLVSTQAHTIFLMECHIYLKYALWHYHLHHYDWLRNLREVRSIFHIFNNQTMLWILHLKYTFSVGAWKCFYFSVMFSVWSHRTVLVSQIYRCLVTDNNSATLNSLSKTNHVRKEKTTVIQMSCNKGRDT